MRLKILHVDSGSTWRGGQRQVLLLAQGLLARGHEVMIAGGAGARGRDSDEGDDVPSSPLLARAAKLGIPTAEIPMRGDLDLPAAVRIHKLLQSFNANIVHAHDARSHAIAMLALLRTENVPLIVTRRVAYTPKSVRIKYGKRVARFIAISNAVKQSMVDAGVAEDRIKVVYSGVPAIPRGDEKGEMGDEPGIGYQYRNWRAERHWPANAVICGVVGAMTAEKGLDTVAMVAKRLRGDASSRARLVLLGGGQDGAEIGPRTLGGVDSFGAGFVEDIHGAMAGLDMLWHPSSSEGLGTAVIDAMALGVPPVAFATGGLPELIEDGVNGVLVPPGNVESYAMAATRLICNADERKRLAEAGPARAAQFGVELMIENTEKVYHQVIS